MLISWTKLLVRQSAASIESGLFVASMTMTGLLSFFSDDVTVPWSQRMDSGYTGENSRSMHVRNCAAILSPSPAARLRVST